LQQEWGRKGMHIGFWLEARRKGNIGKRRRRSVDILKINFRWELASVTGAIQELSRDGNTGNFTQHRILKMCLLHYRM
jgi:hypothetical protein